MHNELSERLDDIPAPELIMSRGQQFGFVIGRMNRIPQKLGY